MLGDLGHDVESLVFSIADLDYNRWDGYRLGDMDRYGLVKTDKQYRLLKVKMAYYAVQNVVAIFDDTLVRVPDYPCEVQCEKADGLLRLQETSRAASRCWCSGTRAACRRTATTPCPPRSPLPKAAFTEPVWVDTITGGIFEIPKEKFSVEGEKVIFKDIPVYDAPTFIADKSLLVQGTK